MRREFNESSNGSRTFAVAASNRSCLKHRCFSVVEQTEEYLN